jgi:hypothetical protein
MVRGQALDPDCTCKIQTKAKPSHLDERREEEANKKRLVKRFEL